MEIKTAIQLSALDRINTQTLQDLQDAGFDGIAVSFYGAADAVLRRQNWRTEVIELRNLLAQYHFPCVQTHLPCYAIRRSSDEACEEEATLIARGIEATALLNARWGAWHPRTDFNHGFNRENAWHDNVRELTRFLPLAEQFDVGIAVENLPVFPDDREVLFFSSDYRDLMRVVDTMNTPHIGVCWDTGHANLMSFHQATAIREMGSRIRIVHLDSNLGNADVHTPPSLGTVPWSEVIPALQDTGFNGSLTLEVQLPEPSVQRSYYLHCGESARFLRNFWHF